MNKASDSGTGPRAFPVGPYSALTVFQDGDRLRWRVPLVALANPAWVELDPADASDPDFAPSPTERDPRWRVIVRREPELDQ